MPDTEPDADLGAQQPGMPPLQRAGLDQVGGPPGSTGSHAGTAPTTIANAPETTRRPLINRDS